MVLPEFLTADEFGSIRISNHRIGLAHVLHYYNEGYSPEMLWSEFARLPLALIHKIIAFYLENQAEVDAYLARCHEEVQLQRASTPQPPTIAELRLRLESSRKVQGA